jgi:hypothetical protein
MGEASLSLQLLDHMPRLTLERIGELGMANARANAPWGRSIRELKTEGAKAIVIAAGPSLHRTDVATKIADFTGTVIATDSALRYCLRNQIIPDLVVTLDPHAKRIVRWFGDPDLVSTDIEADDYFARQDMDPVFRNEVRANEDVLRLMDLYGKGIKLAVSTTSHPSVVKRAKEIGMEMYWWNPMLDDPDHHGMTQELMDLNGLPCVNAGGNVGSACWMFADAVLNKKKVALTGMDFGYYEDTPYRSTQYYTEALEIVGEENLASVFQRIFNPFVGKWFYTDPAYLWYRDCFLEMVKDAECETYNCTEGGILFGDRIKIRALEDFLND